MPRIPETELQRLKEQVSLLRLIESQGHTPEKRGKDYVMRCLFHEEDSPSLVISPAKNLYHCFGCGAAGGVIDWVMKTQGVSFPHAVELLRHDAPLSAGKPGLTLAKPIYGHRKSKARDPRFTPFLLLAAFASEQPPSG